MTDRLRSTITQDTQERNLEWSLPVFPQRSPPGSAGWKVGWEKGRN